MCMPTKILVGIILLQWIFISHLLVHQLLIDGDDGGGRGGEHHGPTAVVTSLKSSEVVAESRQLERKESRPVFKGVAATLMLNNPKWFQRRYIYGETDMLLVSSLFFMQVRISSYLMIHFLISFLYPQYSWYFDIYGVSRYTMMIQNVLFNIPTDWGIQIFYTGKVSTYNMIKIRVLEILWLSWYWVHMIYSLTMKNDAWLFGLKKWILALLQGQSKFGLEISPGLTRLIETYPNRIIITTIPPGEAGHSKRYLLRVLCTSYNHSSLVCLCRSLDIIKENPKPKQLWTTEWIWKNMLLLSTNNNENAKDNDY